MEGGRCASKKLSGFAPASRAFFSGRRRRFVRLTQASIDACSAYRFAKLCSEAEVPNRSLAASSLQPVEYGSQPA